jgi:dipeptidase E
MSINRILALSSSRVGNNGYLQNAAPIIKKFLGEGSLTIAFIPFAAVGIQYEAYANAVKKGLEGLPYTIHIVLPENAKELIEKADVIMVGGGNTFKLLHDIYAYKLLDVIRNKVNKGTPYIGWSAGANIVSPSIGTTNDMPVIEPSSFNALGLLPFQINPHYTNEHLQGHHGETRDQRLEEFIQLNPGVAIIGLPEGTALQLENGLLQFIGEMPGILFYTEENEDKPLKREINESTDLAFLL